MYTLNDLSNGTIAALLNQNKVGVIPTDTVYGLVCRADSIVAVKRLYEVKKRDTKPGTLIAANLHQLIDLGLKARYLKACEQFWPNPLSVVIPSYELAYIHLGVGSIAVRIPKNDALTSLLHLTGPLLTTSANMPGESTSRTIIEAKAYFKNTVDFYTDGGDLSQNKPSTIIQIVDDSIVLLRRGAVNIDESTGRIS